MNQGHFLFLYSAVLFAIFLTYVFYCDHKTHLSDDWNEVFSGIGIHKKIVETIQHDNDVWYVNGQSTCVGYGVPGEYCDYKTVYCTNEDCGKVTDKGYVIGVWNAKKFLCDACFEAGIQRNMTRDIPKVISHAYKRPQ